MRLSQAVSPAEKIVVPFANGAELLVMYRPTSYTPNQLDKMQAEAAEKGKTREGMKSLVRSMRGMIESWDLTDEDDVVIPVEEPKLLTNPDGSPQLGEDGVQLVEPDAMMDVPLNVYMGIMKQVNAEQQAGEA